MTLKLEKRHYIRLEGQSVPIRRAKIRYEQLNNCSIVIMVKGEKMVRDHEDMHATCDCISIHQDRVERAKHTMPDHDALITSAEFFRVLGDGTRVAIVSALRTEELCVCDLSAVLNMTQSAISHQLRILKQARLVRYRREGKIVYYRLDDEHIGSLLDIGLAHTAENGTHL